MKLSQPGPYDLLLGIFILSALAALPTGYDWRLGIPTVLMLGVGLILYLLVSRLFARSDRWKWAVKAGVGIGATIAFFFILQFLYQGLGETSGAAAKPGDLLAGLTPAGTLWKPYANSIAMFLEGIFVLGLAVVGMAPSSRSRLIWGAAVGLIGIALLLTGSRGAWLGIAGAALIWVGKSWRPGRWPIFLSMASLFGLGLYVVFQRSQEAVKNIPLLSDLLGPLFFRPDRLEVYQNALALIADVPFTGIGVGDQFGFVYSRYELAIPYLYLDYSHNLWLETWLELGLAGFIVLNLLILSIYQNASLPLKLPHRFNFDCTWIGLTTIIIHGLFDACMYDHLWSWLPFFYLSGLNAALLLEAPASRVKRTPWLHAGVFVAVLAAFAVGFQPLSARWFTNLGSLAQHRADLTPGLSEEQRLSLQIEAENYFRKALQIQPHQRSANQRLGMIEMGSYQFEDAVPYLAAAHTAEPGHFASRKLYGLASAFSGNLDQAESALKNIADIRNELNHWGWIFTDRGFTKTAIYSYRLSLRLFPDQPEIEKQILSLEFK